MLLDLLPEMLNRNFVTLFLILLFSIRLWTKKSFRDSDTKYFWLTVISCLLLVLQDSLEVMTSHDPSLRFFRIALSVLGYTLRSVSALSLLLVVVAQNQRRFILWVPSLITLACCSTAFFNNWAFWFDDNYDFYRGPLGYVAFVVPTFYLLLILWITFRRFSEKNGIEKYIPPLGGVFCLSVSVVDALYGGARLNEAIVCCGVFFYMFLYSHDNRRDPLTGLLNRQAFYDDCAAFGKNIGAVASIDMNGLKPLNDAHGHKAGDEALKTIGECLGAITDRNASAYRIGGDEFVILFFDEDEKRVLMTVRNLREAVAAGGYSISAGHAMRDGRSDLEVLIAESDRRMSEDKEAYYRETGLARRAVPAPETEN